ncbi:exocyst complex component EXO70A1-like [Panicum miliaceum]|uniref:Exocyst subunit Exo70 family protein n=1 Tax=Panicum miliaceum TaxID=4540 RepID=A0A3L6SKI8_PANMI|nr:exocyst complex component EXO70A1-like [Panicum miliaceum]
MADDAGGSKEEHARRAQALQTSEASSGGEVDASDGTLSRASSGVPDEVAALLEGEIWDELDLVRPAGVSVLHEIALRMVRAGCTNHQGALPGVRERSLRCARQFHCPCLSDRWITIMDILTKLADAMKIVVNGVVAKVQGDCPRTPSAAGGVHPLACDAMTCVELLARHRTTLDLILAGGGERDAPVGSLAAGLVAELIAGLERNLEGKLAVACADAGGSRHLFLANNISFILNRAADAGGVASLLGDAWDPDKTLSARDSGRPPAGGRRQRSPTRRPISDGPTPFRSSPQIRLFVYLHNT